MAAIAMVTASLAGGHLVSSPSPIFNKSSSMNLRFSNLASVTSQLSGIKVSCDPACFQLPPSTISAPFRPSIQPVARRVCPFTGKKSNNGNKVSHSNHKTKRLQFVNLQYKKIWWEAGNRYLKLRLSTKAIKTIEKNGLDVVAKKAGIDLRKL